MFAIRSEQRGDLFCRSEGINPLDIMTRMRVVVVGCGALGSWTAEYLARSGCGALTLYDPDKVGWENLGPQAFTAGDIGRYKAEALADRLRTLYGCRAEARVRRYGEGDMDTVHTTGQIVVCGVDSMSARAEIWAGVSGKLSGAAWYIDGRMAGESGTIYVVGMGERGSAERYAATLYSDDSVDPAPCIEKATAYNAGIMGGYMAGLAVSRWRAFARGERVPATFSHYELGLAGVEQLS